MSAAAAGRVVFDFESTNDDDIITEGDNLIIVVFVFVVVVDAVVDHDHGKSCRRDVDAKAADAAITKDGGRHRRSSSVQRGRRRRLRCWRSAGDADAVRPWGSGLTLSKMVMGGRR
jgi:hypothetical protein